MRKSLQDAQAEISAIQVRIQADDHGCEERTRQRAAVEKQVVAIQSRIE